MITAAARRTIPSPAPTPRPRAKALPRLSPGRRIRLQDEGGAVMSLQLGGVLRITGLAGLIAGEYIVERLTPGLGATSTSLSIRLKAVVPKAPPKAKRTAKPARKRARR